MKQLRHFIKTDTHSKNGDPFVSNKIKENAEYGKHIPIRCTKCGAIGHTKNIGYIGARTIFPGCSCDAEYEVVE